MTDGEKLSQVIFLIRSAENSSHDAQLDVIDTWIDAQSKGFDVNALRYIIHKIETGSIDRFDQEQLVNEYLLAITPTNP